MSVKDDYLALAAKARAEAEATNLANVKERCLRSEAAWNEMAAAAKRRDVLRADRAP